MIRKRSLFSRTHGNWSATAYPAAALLVTAVMLELDRRILFLVSLGLHLAIAVMLAAAPAFALQLPLFERLQFLSGVVGWCDRGRYARAGRRASLLSP